MQRRLCTTAALVLASALLTACAGNAPGGGGDGEAFEPTKVDLVVHTGPGGGSDLFARQLTDTLDKTDLSSARWTVRNENGGSGASAMAYMRGKAGRDDTIAMTTPTWLTTPITNSEAEVTIDQMTPIAQLATEPMVMAVKADSPYRSLQDFIDDARGKPNKLVQTGGSVTSVDALAGKIIQDETKTKWRYLSYEGGGERIAAILGGDADMIFAAGAELKEQVRAKKMRVLASIDAEPSSVFPDAPTLADEGIDVEIPQQIRGVVGPPEMPKEAVTYYEGVLRKVLETKEWKAYAEANGLENAFVDSAEFGQKLAKEKKLMQGVLERLGLAKS